MSTAAAHAQVTSTIDIPFFTAEAPRVGKPDLELMVGYGRVSVPLVRAGVDQPGPMLYWLRGKLDNTVLQSRICRADFATMRMTYVRAMRLYGINDLDGRVTEKRNLDVMFASLTTAA